MKMNVKGKISTIYKKKTEVEMGGNNIENDMRVVSAVRVGHVNDRCERRHRTRVTQMCM